MQVSYPSASRTVGQQQKVCLQVGQLFLLLLPLHEVDHLSHPLSLYLTLLFWNVLLLFLTQLSSSFSSTCFCSLIPESAEVSFSEVPLLTEVTRPPGIHQEFSCPDFPTIRHSVLGTAPCPSYNFRPTCLKVPLSFFFNQATLCVAEFQEGSRS